MMRQYYNLYKLVKDLIDCPEFHHMAIILILYYRLHTKKKNCIYSLFQCVCNLIIHTKLQLVFKPGPYDGNILE